MNARDRCDLAENAARARRADRADARARITAAALELPEHDRPLCFCTSTYCGGAVCSSRPTLPRTTTPKENRP